MDTLSGIYRYKTINSLEKLEFQFFKNALQLPEAMADDALVAYSIARIAEKGIRRDGSAGIWATAVRAREVQAVRRESGRFLLFGITASLVTILLCMPKQM